jgi:hypothetical protein
MVRTAAGLLLIVLTLPLIACALFVVVRILSQHGMEERDQGFLIMSALALVIALPFAIVGARLARGKLLLMCTRCRRPADSQQV